MHLDVIVLAAGQGKRMQSALPKVLHPLAGKPLLAHVLDCARELAPRGIYVVHGHRGEAIRQAIADPMIAWVEQSTQSGTGHAVLQAVPLLADDAQVLVMYGDVPLMRASTLSTLVQAAANGLAILSVRLEDPFGYGRIVRDDTGRVTRVVEQKDASGETLAIREVNAGFLCARASHLRGWLARVRNDNAQGEYYLTDVIGIAADSGVDIATVTVDDAWEAAGVNSKRELAALERELQRRRADELLDAGVTLADPSRIDVRGDLRCGRDVSIDVNCVFEGEVRLGDGVRIGPNCVVKNTTVADRTEVHAYSHLENAKVGAACRIGPYARLRPGTDLAEDVHIGNFVEVKASRVGAGSKANHLAYVGDAEVGRGVNIGAGTITCNYDGTAKHRTIIEDECFIGSDTTLVAPVTLAKGSYIGAGSTISKDTPADQLTVARARQVSIPSWRAPTKKK